jgi:hypothetical protein
MYFSSSGGIEVIQPLLGDGQLLGRQSGLLVPQNDLSTIGTELAGQDLSTGVL